MSRRANSVTKRQSVSFDNVPGYTRLVQLHSAYDPFREAPAFLPASGPGIVFDVPAPMFVHVVNDLISNSWLTYMNQFGLSVGRIEESQIPTLAGILQFETGYKLTIVQSWLVRRSTVLSHFYNEVVEWNDLPLLCLMWDYCRYSMLDEDDEALIDARSYFFSLLENAWSTS